LKVHNKYYIYHLENLSQKRVLKSSYIDMVFQLSNTDANKRRLQTSNYLVSTLPA
jgi:hypothetical protein